MLTTALLRLVQASLAVNKQLALHYGQDWSQHTAATAGTGLSMTSYDTQTMCRALADPMQLQKAYCR
jgi:hypothetical protein